MKYFEWDENKRNLNIEKHGIDFIDAIHVFDDPLRVEVETMRGIEKRYQTIGRIEDVTILVAYTYRNEKRRIISTRVASRAERAVYEKMR